MQWLNEPGVWHQGDNTIEIVTDDRTDFWRKTHYGFIRDNGHFYFREVSGDFTASVKVEGEYKELYDQAGLMVRLDETRWIKTGIEFTDAQSHFSVVVTHDQSDWSVVPLTAASPLFLRVTRNGTALLIQYSLDDSRYHLARLCSLPADSSLQVGVMACSPQRAGFKARFENFLVGPSTGRLHE